MEQSKKLYLNKAMHQHDISHQPPEAITVLSPVIKEKLFPGVKYYEMAKEGHFWITWRFSIFLYQINRLNISRQHPLTGLDAGCGNGVVRCQIEKYTNWTCDGAELTREALLLNNTEKGYSYLYDIQDCHTSLKEAYDFIILFDVLEHVEHTQEFLESLSYHLKPEGWLFMNVPALPILFSKYDSAQNHFRRYTKKLLRAEFANSPFEVQDMRYWGLSLLPLALSRKLLLNHQQRSSQDILKKGFNPPSNLINRWLLRLMKLETSIMSIPPLGTSLMTVARKLER